MRTVRIVTASTAAIVAALSRLLWPIALAAIFLALAAIIIIALAAFSHRRVPMERLRALVLDIRDGRPPEADHAATRRHKALRRPRQLGPPARSRAAERHRPTVPQNRPRSHHHGATPGAYGIRPRSRSHRADGPSR